MLKLTFVIIMLNTADYTQLVQIAENTKWSFWQDGVCLIAIISLILSFATLNTLYREFRKDRLDAECQRKLFYDIVRHLYRNKLCTLAMQLKYEACLDKDEKFAGYPSEEHYKKLQLLPNDIHLERYNRNASMHQKMHELELLLRNYNTEIEVAERHIINPQIGQDTKKRDFETLDFKTGYLTKRVFDVMQAIYPKEDVKEQLRELIYESQTNNTIANSDKTLWGMQYEDAIKELLEAKEKGDWYFKHIFDNNFAADRFSESLFSDMLIECGQNSQHEEKIHIIKLNVK